MFLKSSAMVGVCGCALFAGGNASATYLGVTTVLHTTVTVGGASRSVFRVYARFDNATDFVTAVAGSDLLGNMKIQSRNSDDTGLGGAFYNPGGAGSNTAPYEPDGSVEYGTFATIGISLATQGSGEGGADQTSVTPGFPNFIATNQLNYNNLGWYTPGPCLQGRAGYLGDGDPQLRVLLMQLTVNAGEHVRSTVAVSGVHTVALASPVMFTAVNQQTTSVPVPGVLGVMGLIGLVSARSRRRVC